MSFWELVVILIVALVVIKPERMPEVAYMVGKAIGRIRHWYRTTLQKFSSLS